MKSITITEKEGGERFDIVAASLFPVLSRTNVHMLIKQGRVLINGSQEKAGYKLKVGDVITTDFDESELNSVQSIDLPILYEDDDCIVINKPTGILTHSKGTFNPEATIASFIKPLLVDMEGDRAGIVHRLDRATSGVIICAKNSDAHRWLQKQFSQRKVKKTYYAIVSSGISPQEAVIDMPIERNPANPKQFRVGTHGKPAQTAYKIIDSDDLFDLLKLKPVTGRTHQLRVHLKHLGYPIVGDTLYNGIPAPRLMLHAHTLELTLPSRRRQTFIAPKPSDFTL